MTGFGPGPSRDEVLLARQLLIPVGMKRGRPEPEPPRLPAHSSPQRWVVASLEEVTDPVRTISYGILKPGPNLPEGIPYVKVVNMRGERIDVAGLHRTSYEIADAYGRSRLTPGDVLVSIRGTFGRVAMVPKELEGANITQDTARLAFTRVLLPAFGALFLRSPEAQGFLKQHSRGVAVKGVNIGDLRAMPIPVPALEEQQSIIETVEAHLSDLDAAAAALKVALAREIQLRRSVLSAAVGGRLSEAKRGGESANV